MQRDLHFAQGKSEEVMTTVSVDGQMVTTTSLIALTHILQYKSKSY